ncbi:MAG TPA: hypothetical protein VGW38_23905 [Chloroflexota bacterium]|nr:hypothetical protein [Chloroflexota bacterium]
MRRGARWAIPAILLSSLVGAGTVGAQYYGPPANQPGLFEPGLSQPGFTPNAPGLIEPGLNRPGFQPNPYLGLSPGVTPGVGVGVRPFYRATIDDILDNLELFTGQQVVVGGELDRQVGFRGFTLEDSDILFDEDILVLSAPPWASVLGFREWFGLGDPFVRVRGVVHWLNPVAFERAWGAASTMRCSPSGKANR